jgi:hypothetical protein
MRHVVEWNGRDVPEALRELPPGRYLLVEETNPADLEGLRSLALREAGAASSERAASRDAKRETPKT